MALADFKTTATEKLDDGVHTVKRVVRHGAQDLEDLRDATALKIRRSPFQTVAIAVGSGLLLGLAIGLAKGRGRTGNTTKT